MGPESFYVTNWVYFTNPLLSQLENLVLQLHWSNLVYYNNGEVKIVADGFMMANGVNMSPDNR